MSYDKASYSLAFIDGIFFNKNHFDSFLCQKKMVFYLKSLKKVERKEEVKSSSRNIIFGAFLSGLGFLHLYAFESLHFFCR